MSISCKHENSLVRSIKKRKNNRSLLVIHFKYSSVYMTFPKSLAHGALLNVMCRLVGKGVWGRMDIHMPVADSLCCSPETTTTLVIGYIPAQNVFGVRK